MSGLTLKERLFGGRNKSNAGIALSIDLERRRLASYYMRDSKARSRFFRRMEALLRSGVTIYDAVRMIDALYDRRRAKRHASAMGKLFVPVSKEERLAALLLREMERGYTFVRALNGIFPAIEISIVASSESAGASGSDGLSEADYFAQAAQNAEISERLKQEVMNNVLPIFAGVGRALLLIVISVLMGPTMIGNLTGGKEPPALASAYLSVSETAAYLAPAIFLGIIFYYIWATLVYPRYFVGRDALDALPLFGMKKNLDAAGFLATLSMLVSSVPLSQALSIIQSVANDYVRHHVANIERRLRAGRSGGDALSATSFFDEDVRDELYIYAGTESTSFAKILQHIAETAREAAINRIRFAGKITKGFASSLGWIFLIFMLTAIVAVIADMLSVLKGIG